MSHRLSVLLVALKYYGNGCHHSLPLTLKIKKNIWKFEHFKIFLIRANNIKHCEYSKGNAYRPT